MNWDKALRQIEQALAEGKDVTVRYHRKWMTNSSRWDKVYDISEYEWDGETCKVVNTYSDQIDKAMHIIDSVEVE